MTRRFLLFVVFLAALPSRGNAQSPAAAAPAFVVAPSAIVFGALLRPGGAIVTPPQRVFLETTASQGSSWTAAADRNWLDVQPVSGVLPSRLTLAIRPSAFAAGLRDDEARVTIAAASRAGSSQQVLIVRLQVSSESHPPIGSYDAPAEDAVAAGSVRLFGWALDDEGLASVSICRDAAPRLPASESCGGRALVGDASIYDYARPDVAAAFPALPRRERAGWTYLLDAATLPHGARGTFRVYVVATGIDGARAVIGAKTITVLPGPRSWLPSAPHLRALVALIVLWLLVHVLFRWLCAPRLREDDAGIASNAAPSVAWFEIVSLVFIVVVSFVMDVPVLGRGLTYDELFTASHFAVGVPFWTAAFHAPTFTNHIAYSLLAALSVRVLGPSEFALRLPATVLGALTLVALWWYARSWLGRTPGVVAAALLAIMPFHAQWSRMARGYTGLALMTVVAIGGFTGVVRRGSGRAAVEHALGLVLAVYFHLYAVFVFLTQYVLFAALALLGVSRQAATLTRRKFVLLWWSFLCAAGVLAVLYAPVIGDFLTSLSYYSDRGGVSAAILVEVFGAFAGVGALVVRLAVLALFALGIVCAWRRSRVDAVHLIALIVLPVALVAVVLRPTVQLDRYFAFLSPVFVLFVAAGLSLLAARRAGVVRWIGSALAAALVVVLAVTWIRRDASAGPDAGPGYRAILQQLNAPPDAPVFVVGADAEMFQYYVRRRLVALHAPNDLESQLLDAPWFRVAYHDVPWNSPDQRQTADMLRARCALTARAGPVTIFVCGR